VALARRPSRRPSPRADVPARDRFRTLDAYRARRELQRYAGTGQRDLYRELRERFLARHRVPDGWAVDLGSGPGRFLAYIGGTGSRKVALDISREMLKLVDEGGASSGAVPPRADRVRGDALRPPLAIGRWSEVVLLGNTLGFAEDSSERLLRASEILVRPGGVLVTEIAPSSGERSRYLARLPPSALGRLLRAPTAALLPRILREGFRPEPARRKHAGEFRRLHVADLHARWHTAEWEVTETIAVAPAIGADGSRIAAARKDPKAWDHLLEVEEALGRLPDRWPHAASVLLAVRRRAAEAED